MEEVNRGPCAVQGVGPDRFVRFSFLANSGDTMIDAYPAVLQMEDISFQLNKVIKEGQMFLPDNLKAKFLTADQPPSRCLQILITMIETV